MEQASERVGLHVERFVIDSVVQNPRPFQSHQEMRLAGRWQALTPKGGLSLAFEREQPSLDSLEGAE